MKTEEIRYELKNNFDCISKLDAIRFIKEIDKRTEIKSIVEVYNELYN